MSNAVIFDIISTKTNIHSLGECTSRGFCLSVLPDSGRTFILNILYKGTLRACQLAAFGYFHALRRDRAHTAVEGTRYS